MFEIIVLIFTVLANLLLGLFVFLKNPEALKNKLFLLLTLSFALWSTISYISVHPFLFDQIVWVRLVLFAAALLNLSVFLTFLVFPENEMSKKNKRWAVSAIVATCFVLPLTLSSFVFKELQLTTDGLKTIVAPGIALFMLHTVVLLGSSIVNILRKYFKSKGIERAQLKVVLFGILGTFALIITTNFLLVVLFHFNDLIPLGPAFTVIFSGSLGYSIVRLKLFDIKAIVARGVVYVLVTFFIVIFYVLFANIFKLVVFPNTEISVNQIISNSVLTVVLVLLYPSLKSYFDSLTNKIFFRDAYDAQSLIDELNKALVNNVELDSLLTKTALVIQENMKASYCTFYIRETSYFPDRIIGAHRHDPEIDHIDRVQELTAKVGKKVFSAETDPTNDNDEELAKLLKSNDIEVVARLVNTLDYEVKGIGFLFIGPKRSGSLYSKQDLKVLEIVANELVIAIENVLRFEEIEEFNVTLQKKIDTATRELKQSNDKLKALDEAKDEFVSMASHQLRTPLTSIKGYISMVMDGDAGKVNETQEKMLGQAFFSSQRMVYLISDLLNVSRLKTGKFLIESKPVYLPDVVESEIEQLQEGAKVKDILLSFIKPKKFATLSLDEMKIRQVIMNFTDNALHYTPSGGKINVELKETQKSVEFTVTDSGIGVPKEQQPKLFTKFYRADNARKARPDGTGLGLFMAKKVIIAQGGSVIFDSKEGKGSTFGFSFPKEKLEVEPQPKRLIN